MAHGKRRGRMGCMWKRAHTYQGRVHLGRPQAAQKFLPSAWSTSIPRWRPVGGALTAYISAHSTSHPALRGTPFTSTIHPLRHPSWRARPHRRVRSSWGRQRWGLGGIVGSRDVRADIGIALERRATFAPGNTELPSFTRSARFSTPVARDSFFLQKYRRSLTTTPADPPTCLGPEIPSTYTLSIEYSFVFSFRSFIKFPVA